MSADRWIDVDLDAVRHNIRVVRTTIAPASLMLVVKDDAYGHGLWPVVRTALAEGVEAIGSLDVESALRLRDGGVPNSVLIFAWQLVPGASATEAVDRHVDLGVSSDAELRTIAAHEARTPARIHLKIDTGLGRNGARVEDWPALVRAARRLEDEGIVQIVGVWTHIAEASYGEDSDSIAAFHTAIDLVQTGRARPLLRHLAASAASFARADSRFDLARVGAFVYGIAPGDGISPESLGLKPVMALRARVIGVEDGQAILPIGTVDGLPSIGAGTLMASASGAPVSVAGIELSRTLIDAELELGETVTLFGDAARGEATLQRWADALETIGEELAVRISPRIDRRPSE
jgi:alanine racemase